MIFTTWSKTWAKNKNHQSAQIWHVYQNNLRKLTANTASVYLLT